MPGVGISQGPEQALMGPPVTLVADGQMDFFNEGVQEEIREIPAIIASSKVPSLAIAA